MKTFTLAILLLLCFYGFTPAQTTQLVKSASGNYLNQEPPGLTSKLFAPGLISLKDRYEFGSVFTRDGKEFYYGIEGAQRPHIEYIKFENNKWSAPVKLIISDKYGYNDPFLSPDENRLYFISDQAMDGKGDKKDIDIWYVQREKNGWSQPINAGKEINSAHNEYYISFTKTGTMYYSSNKAADNVKSNQYDIYSSPLLKTSHGPSVKLGAAINTEHYEADVFVSPNEDYLIYCAERPDGNGKGDLFISFKDANGAWTKAKNMGTAVNTQGYEFCPFVTGDGKYLFFSRDGDIYWVDAKVINALR
jgi:hypothetical protein